MIIRITNLGNIPYSTDVENSAGEMIRQYIPVGESVDITDIDPYYLNQDSILREEVFGPARLSVEFIAEPDDLIGLPPAAGTVAGNKLIQTQRVQLAVNAATSIAWPVYATLITVPITTTTGNTLSIIGAFSGNASRNDTEINARIRLNGTPLDGALMTAGIVRGTGTSILTYTGITAGAHTVDLQWTRTNPPATPTALFVSAASVPNRHFATLAVQEMTTP